jgi:hypothetical protein
VIRGRARERKPQRDINGVAERCDLDCGHPDVVIWRNHGVEFSAHRSHEDRIRRKGPIDTCRARGRLEELRVFAAESPAIAAVRIQSAQRNSRRRDSEPCAEAFARDARSFDDGRRAQILSDAAKWNVCRCKHHTQLVGRKHHGDAGRSQCSEHLGVAGIVVASRKQRRFIDGGGDDSFDVSGLCHLNGPFDCESAEHAREGDVRAGPPVADRLSNLHFGAGGPNDHNVAALADPWVGERFGDYLRTNSAGITHGHGKARFHCYILSDT